MGFPEKEVEAKYKGSSLGILWASINPIIMLGIYTIVFSRIFRARWGNIGFGKAQSNGICY